MPESTSRHSWDEALAAHYKTGDYVPLGIWAQDNVPGLIERLEALDAACRELLEAYDEEEEEHGFPFNFRLRDAHRALKRLVSTPASRDEP
jgi:hypothetical protein